MVVELDLKVLNETLCNAPAITVIRQGLALAQRPFVSTKFGPESAVLLHLMVQEQPAIPVVWVDTGFNTRATQHFAEQLTERLKLNLKIYRPRQAWLDFPPDLATPEHTRFTQWVKFEPFARALEDLRPDMWFCSIRRQQTQYRNDQQLFSQTASGLLKAAPLLGWSHADMQNYLTAHGLPAETDYHDPTKGQPRRECGLHLTF